MAWCSRRCESQVKLTGKTAIITGSNTGIGKETALDFYKRGAKVIMGCRSIDKAEEAKKSIETSCKDLNEKGNLVIEKLDLSSLKSVREFAKKIIDTEPQVNILVNNAGVMMCPKMETEDGFEMQFGTNHLGHFLLTLLLLPRIKNSTPARIVTVSSLAHTWSDMSFDDLNYKTKKYNAREAYARSKLANILFSRELAKQLKNYNIQGINTYSLHPGVIRSELGRHLDKTFFPGATAISGIITRPFSKSVEMGAQTNIYCSVDEKCANETGLYYSDCALTKANADASNNDYAEKLWKISSELVGLGDYDPFTAPDQGLSQ